MARSRHRLPLLALLLAAGLRPGAVAAQTHLPPPTAEGQPDLQGVWQVLNTAAWDIQDHPATLGVPPGRGVVDGNDLPYRPESAIRKQQNFDQRATADPDHRCYLPGVPRITYMPLPFQIFQTPKYTVIAYAWGHAARLIFTDGSDHPEQIDFWMGDSRGRWEGQTLVVDVRNFNDQTWFDRAGNFHSDALHVVERYTLIDTDHLRYTATIEDPKVFTRPWTMSMILYRRKDADAEILEYACPAYLVDEASTP